LWSENLMDIARYSPVYGLKFGFYEVFKEHTKVNVVENGLNKFGFFILSGGEAGITTSLLVHPIHYYSCYTYHKFFILQEFKDQKKVFYKSNFKFYRNQINDFFKFYQNTSFYSAFSYSIIPNFLYNSIFFGGYDIGKSLVFENKENEKKDNNKNIKRFSIAFIVNIISHIVSYPFETVCNTMLIQSVVCKLDSVSTKDKKEFFSSSLDCFKKIIRYEGFKSLFDGAIKSPI
ncbi:hypothetical protein DICPUDRAFT_19937, partial [Dictyostelium purpureum]